MADEAQAEELLEGLPAGLQSFIRITDSDDGTVILNVREIVGVFELIGKAKDAAPDGANSRIALRTGNNIPVKATVDEIGALLSQVAVVGFSEELETLTRPSDINIAGLHLTTPDNPR